MILFVLGALDDFDINKSSKDKDSKENGDVEKDDKAAGDIPEEWNEEYLKYRGIRN